MVLNKKFNSCILVLLLLLNLSPLNANEKLKQINVEITSHLGDKQSFVKGDILKFLINLDRDSYLTVIYQTADDKLIQLLPNKKHYNTLYKANLFIAVPNDTAAYRFVIQAPYGKETVWVFASDKQPSSLKLTSKNLSNGLRLLTVSLETIKAKIKAHSENYFGQARFILQTSN